MAHALDRKITIRPPLGEPFDLVVTYQGHRPDKGNLFEAVLPKDISWGLMHYIVYVVLPGTINPWDVAVGPQAGREIVLHWFEKEEA